LRSFVVFAQTPLQSVVPAGHAQAALTQVLPPVQATPQPPQFAMSCSVLTQPPEQLVVLVGHAEMHVPASLTGAHTVPTLQTDVQDPQWNGSRLESTQMPQSVLPTGQVQTSPWQTLPPEQRTPQAPQLLGSELVFTHEPPQLVYVVGQPPAAQRASWQVAAGPHAEPQAPQFARSFDKSTQAPLQSVRPERHLQLPATQVWPPWHSVPQLLQLWLSL
jgi:hypothetical protein